MEGEKEGVIPTKDVRRAMVYVMLIYSFSLSLRPFSHSTWSITFISPFSRQTLTKVEID